MAAGDHWKQLPVHCGNRASSLVPAPPLQNRPVQEKAWRELSAFQKCLMNENHPSNQKGSQNQSAGMKSNACTTGDNKQRLRAEPKAAPRMVLAAPQPREQMEGKGQASVALRSCQVQHPLPLSRGPWDQPSQHCLSRPSAPTLSKQNAPCARHPQRTLHTSPGTAGLGAVPWASRWASSLAVASLPQINLQVPSLTTLMSSARLHSRLGQPCFTETSGPSSSLLPPCPSPSGCHGSHPRWASVHVAMQTSHVYQLPLRLRLLLPGGLCSPLLC